VSTVLVKTLETIDPQYPQPDDMDWEHVTID
jgi:hypothetical protein